MSVRTPWSPRSVARPLHDEVGGVRRVLDDGEGHRHLRPQAGAGAEDAHGASVCLHEPLDQGQADAEAAMRASLLLLPEHFERERQELRRDPLTRVTDPHNGALAGLLERDVDAATLRSELHRVSEHVSDDLLQTVPVGCDAHAPIGAVEVQRDPLACRGVGHRVDCATKRQAERLGLQVQHRRASGAAGQLEQVFYQPELKPRVAFDRVGATQTLPRAVLAFQDLRPSEDRRERRTQFVRQHGQELVLDDQRGLQTGRRLLVLLRPVRFTQQRVPEHLQQLAVQDQPARRHRLLLAGDVPQTLEGQAAGARQPRHRDGITKIDDRIAGDRRADDGSIDHQGGADDGQPRRGGDDDRRTRIA